MATVMVLSCKKCGKEFRSGIQMDQGSFATGTLVDNQERCPSCGTIATYSKPDYRFTTVKTN